MYKLFQFVILFLFLASCNKSNDNNSAIVSSKIESQLKHGIALTDELLDNDLGLVAPRTIHRNEIAMVKSSDWTSGFFAGELWMMFELTNDPFWLAKAKLYTEKLEKEKLNDRTHDMGFKMYCSYGRGYAITKDSSYKEILVKSAYTLITRYKEPVGCIRSWEHKPERWSCPVIIDNMMNLELLMWAYKETGDETFREVAINHANTSIKNHFRSDYTSYHVVDYDISSGEIREKTTHQGYSAESAWSRGQAWALYGYTMMYRETKIKEYLTQAENIANMILKHPRLPEDLVPYWDFDAPGIPNEPRDASAASVICSALFELSDFSENEMNYLQSANKMFESLSSQNYLAEVGTNEGFLLKHSTGSKPHDSEIDVPLVYADYYYLEAYLRKISNQ